MYHKNKSDLLTLHQPSVFAKNHILPIRNNMILRTMNNLMVISLKTCIVGFFATDSLINARKR